MPEQVILIFDIGKTNKKAFVFNRRWQMRDAYTTSIGTLADEDGVAYEDIDQLGAWLLRTLDECRAHPDYQLAAVNVSAYGATLVHTNAEGKLSAPVYDYLKPITENFVEAFYTHRGGQDQFCTLTASPALGMLNAGVHLAWLAAYREDKFRQTEHSMFLPQYLSFLITGRAVTEPTGLGCHTALWNFRTDQYHDWVTSDEIGSKLPPLSSTTHTETVERQGTRFAVGVGIHDSSASLAVFLEALETPFLLVSTGTWSITLNAFSDDTLSPRDTEHDCLNYLSHHGKKVRASRLFLGNEHDRQVTQLTAHFGCQWDDLECLEPDWSLFDQLRSQQYASLIQLNASPMLTIDYGSFATHTPAYHALVIALLRQQVVSIQRATGSATIQDIYLAGGFCQNRLFAPYLAEMMPQHRIYLADMSEASALGAAAVIQDSWQPERPLREVLSFARVEGRANAPA